jgi:hypothetical protein
MHSGLASRHPPFTDNDKPGCSTASRRAAPCEDRLGYPAQDRAGRIAYGSRGQIIDLQRPRCGHPTPKDERFTHITKTLNRILAAFPQVLQAWNAAMTDRTKAVSNSPSLT